jgi:hypothetical protein
MNPQEKRRRIPDGIYAALISTLIGGAIAVTSSQLALRDQHKHDEKRWREEQESRAAERARTEKLRWLERAIDAVGDARKQLLELNAGLDGLASQQIKYVEARLTAFRDHKPVPPPDPEMLHAADKLIVASDQLELTIYRVLPVVNSRELCDALHELSESHKPKSVVPILSPLVADSLPQLGKDVERLKILNADKKRLTAVHTRLDRALGAVAQDLNLLLVSDEQGTPAAKTAPAASRAPKK